MAPSPFQLTVSTVSPHPSRCWMVAIFFSPKRIEEKYSLTGAICYVLVLCIYGPFYLEGGGFLLPIFCSCFYCVLFFPHLWIQDANPLYFTYGANIYFLLQCPLSLNSVYDVFSPHFSVSKYPKDSFLLSGCPAPPPLYLSG